MDPFEMICAGCLQDEFLRNHVEDIGKVQTFECPWCGSSKRKAISLADMFRVFKTPVHTLFVYAENSHYLGGELLHELICDHLDPFSPDVDDNGLLLANAILGADPEFYSHDGDDPPDYTEGLWRSVNDYDASQEGFLDHLMETVRTLGPHKAMDQLGDFGQLIRWVISFEETLPENAVFYRARQQTRPQRISVDVMGAPPATLAKHNRVSFAHQPALYIAHDLDTVIAEVRPSLNDEVVVGTFKLVRDVRVVSFTRRTPSRSVSPFENPEGRVQEEIMREVYMTLGRMFSQPLRSTDSEDGYFFTQFLSAVLRQRNFDGIEFPSSQHRGGINVVLFDSESAKCESLESVVVENIQYGHVQRK